jgi:hypothetical protein
VKNESCYFSKYYVAYTKRTHIGTMVKNAWQYSLFGFHSTNLKNSLRECPSKETPKTLPSTKAMFPKKPLVNHHSRQCSQLPLTNHHQYNITKDWILISQQPKPKPSTFSWYPKNYFELSTNPHFPLNLYYASITTSKDTLAQQFFWEEI